MTVVGRVERQMHNYHRDLIAMHRRRLRELEDETDEFLSRYEAEFIEMDQRSAELGERWELERREREAELTQRLRWERILMGMSLILFSCAIGLLILAAVSGELYALGGSGAAGATAVLGALRLVLNRGSEPASRRTVY